MGHPPLFRGQDLLYVDGDHKGNAKRFGEFHVKRKRLWISIFTTEEEAEFCWSGLSALIETSEIEHFL